MVAWWGWGVGREGEGRGGRVEVGINTGTGGGIGGEGFGLFYTPPIVETITSISQNGADNIGNKTGSFMVRFRQSQASELEDDAPAQQ